MPVEIKGAYELNKALKKFAPDLEKNLNKEVRAFLMPVVKEAKSLAPSSIPGLSNWTYSQKKYKKITANTSKFRRGKFPKYNVSEVKAGIVAHINPAKENNKGFIALYRIVNASPAGAIYETAGRKHPGGQPWNKKAGSHKYSHSNNPEAGLHFNNSFPRLAGEGNMRGRLIYKAWADNQGRALGGVVKSIERTQATFKGRLDATSAFKKVA